MLSLTGTHPPSSACRRPRLAGLQHTAMQAVHRVVASRTALCQG